MINKVVRLCNHIFLITITITLLLTSMGCSPKIQTIQDIKDRGFITMVTNAEFPPFEYYGKDGKPAGIDIDISREIAKDLGVELKIIDMNFEGVIASIASGKGDFAAAGLTVSAEKEKAVSFSNKYINSQQCIIVLNESTINNMDDLKGKVISTQLGTTSDKLFQDEISNGYLKNTGTKITQRKSYIDIIVDIKNKKVDALALDEPVAKNIIKRYPYLRMFENPKFDSYAIAVRKDNKELIDAINSTITRLKNEGKIDEFFLEHTKIS